MERIIYRKTLDVHKGGVQFTLQGFQTADNMSRTLELSLMASGDTIDLPLEQLMAVMYVTTPNATEPSINECTIKDNTVVCDVLPIVEEGITEVQLKLIDTRVDGAKGVLPTPKFAIEVSKSNTNEEGATQTTTFTALENAVAKAKAVYDKRLLRIELDSDCMFRAYYADGTVYESDVLKELFLKGDALLSQSYAKGGTGVRAGEDTDNSMYYSNVSKSASIEANEMRNSASEILAEVTKHGVYTAFTINFDTGEVEYISPHYSFVINKETGELDAIGEAYTPQESIEVWLDEKSAEIDEKLSNNESAHQELAQAISDEESARIEAIAAETQARETALSNLQENITKHSNNFNSVDESIETFGNRLATVEDSVGNIIAASETEDAKKGVILFTAGDTDIPYTNEPTGRYVADNFTDYSFCYVGLSGFNRILCEIVPKKVTNAETGETKTSIYRIVGMAKDSTYSGYLHSLIHIVNIDVDAKTLEITKNCSYRELKLFDGPSSDGELTFDEASSKTYASPLSSIIGFV